MRVLCGEGDSVGIGPRALCILLKNATTEPYLGPELFSSLQDVCWYTLSIVSWRDNAFISLSVLFMSALTSHVEMCISTLTTCKSSMKL